MTRFGSCLQGGGPHPVKAPAHSSAGRRSHAICLAALLAALLLSACGPRPSVLEQVQKHNELIVLTRNGQTTYYEGPDGPTGFEYELAKLFADYIGVELRIVVPQNFDDILPLVALGDGHLAAAGLTATKTRKKKVRFGPVYQTITPLLIYRSGNRRPESPADLDGLLEVVSSSSHEEHLHRLKKDYPDLSWSAREETSTELLDLVWEGLIDYTVADSNELDISRRYYPELKPAFELSEPESLSWAFPISEDNSLFHSADIFFRKIRKNGTLDQLIERFYGHIREFDYVGTRVYLRHIDLRLPAYQDMFTEVAGNVGLDWRLLAAIGYQESHWDPAAVSPTGVRGIMMLTQAAAGETGVTDRQDPAQSIRGGADYFLRMKARIPEDIPEPDHTWLALAAYNVGLGHLEDARILTQKNKGDPDKWVDVKKNLPLLSKKKWFQQTRYGYARGREPVRYVENIRSYYDILRWETEKDKPDETDSPLLKTVPSAL